jgi:hypothetical protein
MLRAAVAVAARAWLPAGAERVNALLVLVAAARDLSAH